MSQEAVKCSRFKYATREWPCGTERLHEDTEDPAAFTLGRSVFFYFVLSEMDGRTEPRIRIEAREPYPSRPTDQRPVPCKHHERALDVRWRVLVCDNSSPLDAAPLSPLRRAE